LTIGREAATRISACLGSPERIGCFCLVFTRVPFPGRRALTHFAADPNIGPEFGPRPAGGINPVQVATKQIEKKPYRPTEAMAKAKDAESQASGTTEAPAPTAAPQWFGADPLWFKRAVFYEIHIRGYADGNADGIGDFVGLTEKLDYLQWLGIDCIWLLPMYPSPLRDGGYDISDFYSIHPDYGTIDDFRTFIDAAHARGIRVIADLVMNHTSSDHPWFQEARSDPDSPKRDWYVWSDTDERYPDARIIFLDTETSNWTWDPVAGQYYWHRFYASQPDLNYDNPEVQDTMLDVLRFWLDLGLDGFRLDAVPYLYERDGTNGENLPETHEYLKRVRAEIDARYADRALLAEANQWPAEVVDYFGDGDECHMAFQFPIMPRLFLSIRREDATPLVDIIEQTPAIPDSCQWGLFLRNHDELTLEMVTDEERDYMWAEYASDPRMKLNLGIRRRLAPLLDNDRDVVELLTAILFSLPGSPVLYYGDEIGMGDNIYLGDRDGVRTPMQWTGDRSGGFSKADFAQLYLPPLMDPVYGFQAVNVEAQLRTSTSLLRWIHRFIALRKQHPVFALGSFESLRSENHRVLSHIRRHEDEIVLCVHNLARSAQFVELDLSAFRGYVPEEMLGSTHFPPIGELPYLLTLGARGFYWFRLLKDESE
jgi:maltose alpha-D-glucosyltransferase/alpha-amylase